MEFDLEIMLLVRKIAKDIKPKCRIYNLIKYADALRKSFLIITKKNEITFRSTK